MRPLGETQATRTSLVVAPTVTMHCRSSPFTWAPRGVPEDQLMFGAHVASVTVAPYLLWSVALIASAFDPLSRFAASITSMMMEQSTKTVVRLTSRVVSESPESEVNGRFTSLPSFTFTEEGNVSLVVVDSAVFHCAFYVDGDGVLAGVVPVGVVDEVSVVLAREGLVDLTMEVVKEERLEEGKTSTYEILVMRES